MMNATNKSQGLLFSGWKGHQREPVVGDVYTRNQVSIHFDRAEKLYSDWPTPTCILSDGPYGVNGFPGDNHKAESLAEWYEPHIKAWSEHSTPEKRGNSPHRRTMTAECIIVLHPGTYGRLFGKSVR